MHERPAPRRVTYVGLEMRSLTRKMSFQHAQVRTTMSRVSEARRRARHDNSTKYKFCNTAVGKSVGGGGMQFTACQPTRVPPPPFAHARPCLSTGWALNHRFEEILGPLFLWSRMEDWVFVQRLYRERGAQSCL